MDTVGVAGRENDYSWPHATCNWRVGTDSRACLGFAAVSQARLMLLVSGAFGMLTEHSWYARWNLAWLH
jgi:hypothetical protein